MYFTSLLLCAFSENLSFDFCGKSQYYEFGHNTGLDHFPKQVIQGYTSSYASIKHVLNYCHDDHVFSKVKVFSRAFVPVKMCSFC